MRTNWIFVDHRVADRPALLAGLDGHSPWRMIGDASLMRSPALPMRRDASLPPAESTPMQLAVVEATACLSSLPCAPQRLVFVDERVADLTTFLDDLTPGLQFRRVAASDDGLAQVAAALSDLRDVRSLAFIAHGRPDRKSVV